MRIKKYQDIAAVNGGISSISKNNMPLFWFWVSLKKARENNFLRALPTNQINLNFYFFGFSNLEKSIFGATPFAVLENSESIGVVSLKKPQFSIKNWFPSTPPA